MKLLKVMVAVGVLAVVVGVTVFGTRRMTTKGEEIPIVKLEGDLSADLKAADDAANKADKAAMQVRAAATILANTSTPIKVRGGSMTVFTDKAWDPDSGGFCTEMEKRPPSIDFDGDTYNVTDDNWETQIFGTSPDKHTEPNATSPLNRFDASPRGFKLKGKAGPCPQGNGTYHVNLTFVGNDSSSYPNSLAPHPMKHKNANIRFMDSSEQCKGDPVVILGPHDPLGKGDRELCERMRQIKFISGITSATQPLTRDCIDGDCELSIGAPIP